MSVIPLTETQVRNILRYPFDFPWTIQGFGMLRLYMDAEEIRRLHIWDTKQMSVEDVSTVHDHPWDFDSRVISGTLKNQRYRRVEVGADAWVAPPGNHVVVEEWMAQPIRTGEGGHVLSEPEATHLERRLLETYLPGDIYHQDADEIHESLPSRGCVTVVTRTFSRERDLATSYYKDTPEWVSAEPRPATREEIAHFVALALEHWDT